MTPQPCGTDAAFQRHQRRGEPPCEPCRLAHNQVGRDDYAATSPQRRQENVTANRTRYRALSQLAREHPARYLEIYDALRAEAGKATP